MNLKHLSIKELKIELEKVKAERYKFQQEYLKVVCPDDLGAEEYLRWETERSKKFEKGEADCDRRKARIEKELQRKMWEKDERINNKAWEAKKRLKKVLSFKFDDNEVNDPEYLLRIILLLLKKISKPVR